MVGNWWKLLRGWNLIFAGLIPLIIHYGFLRRVFVTALSHTEVFLLALSIASVAAAGYIINDVYDQHADQINKPRKRTIGVTINESTAISAFGVFAILGLTSAGYVAYSIDHWNFIYLHAVCLAILWLYAIDFRGRVLVGNILVALLAALNVLAISLFDTIPVVGIESDRQEIALAFVGILALFAFFETLIREVVKDLEDAKGDRSAGYRTIGTRWPVKRSKALLFVLITLVIAGLVWCIAQMSDDFNAVLWISALLIAPLLIMIFLTFRASDQKDFHRISSLLKVHMFLGLITPAILLFIAV